MFEPLGALSTSRKVEVLSSDLSPFYWTLSRKVELCQFMAAPIILELVHSDVIGPLKIESISVSHYVITFIDDKSNWTVEYTMHRKYK